MEAGVGGTWSNHQEQYSNPECTLRLSPQIFFPNKRVVQKHDGSKQRATKYLDDMFDGHLPESDANGNVYNSNEMWLLAANCQYDTV